MTKQELKLIETALSQTTLKMKAHELPEIGSAVKVVSMFGDRNGDAFAFYAYTRGRSKKIFFTDGGSILKTLQKSGMEIQLGLLQSLVNSYGLSLTQDGAVFDQSDRPMWQRIGGLFQAWCAADGVLRTWTRSESEPRKKKA